MQEFPHITKTEWLAKVEKDLKGKPLDSLNWEVEGETFTPFWHIEDRPSNGNEVTSSRDWKIGVRIPFSSIKESNSLALEALMGGANFLRFDYPGSIEPKEQEDLLTGILVDIIDYAFFDLNAGGNRAYSRENVREYLKVQAETPWPNPRIWLTITDDYFNSIAFLRAVRLCLQQINHEHGLPTDCEIGVMIKATDENADYQKIKNTSQAMAAIIGGADILIIEPSNGEDDSSFERRVARNVQNVLREEAYLHRVADPAAGSYYIEALTDTFARKIWAEFQQLVSK
ncbi:methylmalonyl-CoA mutase family protein [Neolewinella agarilytica]|uniref:methylmalonyl-CoA mutase family protein n=1 Tax=Neolewinella agarilytica TaxID=478744 RepID=UPI0023578ACE|nr:methylmalonyl-CoA mutase family protein [Neolewinella agarilytica]